MTTKKSKIGAKKILSCISTVLSVIIFALAIYVVICIIVSSVKNKPISIFGSSFAIVQTGSMEPTIMTGDLIIYRPIDYDDIKEGDIIVFVADNAFSEDLQGKQIVHRVKEITTEGIITKGDNNSSQDGGVRTEDEIRGICTYNSATLGKIFSFLGTYWIIIVDVIIAIPLIVSLIIKITRLASSDDDGNNGDKNAELPPDTASKAGDSACEDAPPINDGDKNKE